MAMHTPTRRSMIGAIVAAPAAILLPPASYGMTTATVPSGHVGGNSISSALVTLIQEYHAANARLDTFYADVWNPRVDRENDLIEAVPHTVVTIPNGIDDSNPLTLSTASKHDVMRCKGILSVPRSAQSQSANWQRRYDAAVKIVAGDKQRADAFARIHKQTGMDEANRLESEMDGAVNALLDTITDFPARNLHDLSEKLAFQRSVGRSEEAIVDMIEADLPRLLPARH